MSSKSITVEDFSKLPGVFQDNQNYRFKVSPYKNKLGKNKYYEINISVVNKINNKLMDIDKNWFNWGIKMSPDLMAVIDILSWQEGGKIGKRDSTCITAGKNIGKKNETNVFQQALRDGLSIYNKQSKKTGDNGVSGIQFYPPMLLKPYDSEIALTQNLYVQKKYNGVRCVSTLGRQIVKDDQNEKIVESVIMYSRSQNIYPDIEYISSELLPIFKDYSIKGLQIYIDGEIYLHGMPLQEISGYARKDSKLRGDKKLNYIIYDVFVPEQISMPYSKRLELLCEIFKNYGHMKYTQMVETIIVKDVKEAIEYRDKFIAEKYEGAVLRLDLPYEYSRNDYHSKNILKLKAEYDAEFRIIGYELGQKGKTSGMVIMICETDKKLKFNVVPALELSERKAIAQKFADLEKNGKTYFENYIFDKMLNVTFAEYSTDGIPTQPRTNMLIRLPNDISAKITSSGIVN